jgi:hypothetical protein
MKLYLICPTCGSDDAMKNGMTRRGKAPNLCESTVCHCRDQSLDYSKSRGVGSKWMNSGRL